MLTSETKNKINRARDVLVGKIPDPKSQIDQITNALIYKFMDDQDRLSMGVPGGKASFFVGELGEYAWHKLFDSKLSNQDRADLYIKGLDKLSTATKLPELFRDIFKNAYLPFRAPDTVSLFLDEINQFDYHHPEELGNAFEYLLSIMGSQGDAGQFRTPRHIIEFIVKVVAPKKDETIFDPACGTAGFLVEAFNQIKNSSKLTPQELQLLANNIEGFDIDPGMAKIARVNLYLHGFKTPHITENDTLTNENLWLKKKYDVILANPPFMSPKGGIKPHDKFSVKANKSEVLFVNYIIEHLKLQGRAGIIVPEGVIFHPGSAYKQLRKTLVEDGYLSAVVSLPSGVFNPYSGVKTSILILDRERAKVNNEILFVKIENDGHDLGTQRRSIDKNDLPEALEVLEKWNKGEKSESRILNIVSKEKIAESGEYNLSGERYKTSVNIQSKFNLVNVGDFIFEQKERVKDSNNISVWSISNKKGFVLSSEYFDKQVASQDLSNYKLIKPNYFAYNPSRINVGSLAFNNTEKTGAVSPMYVVFSIKERSDLLAGYLFNLLKSDTLNTVILQLSQGAVRQQLRFSDLEKIIIPLPTLKIQEQIVAELDGYQKIIDGAKQVVENWKPAISTDLSWKRLSFKDICYIESRLIDPREDAFSELIHIGAGNIESNSGDLYNLKTAKEEQLISGKFLFDENMILYSKIRPYLVKVARPNFKGLCSADIYPLLPKPEKVIRDFLYYVLLSEEFTKYAVLGSERAGMPKVNRDHLFDFEVGIPPLDIQKQIVEKIEAEKLLVESNKKLIEIYEQKMKDVISKLWTN
jgi:type I restriction enzyme M protein